MMLATAASIVLASVAGLTKPGSPELAVTVNVIVRVNLPPSAAAPPSLKARRATVAGLQANAVGNGAGAAGPTATAKGKGVG